MSKEKQCLRCKSKNAFENDLGKFGKVVLCNKCEETILKCIQKKVKYIKHIQLDKSPVIKPSEEFLKKPLKKKLKNKTDKKQTVEEIFADFEKNDKFEITEFKQDTKKILNKMEKASKAMRGKKDINEQIIKTMSATGDGCKHKNKIVTDRDKKYFSCSDCGKNFY